MDLKRLSNSELHNSFKGAAQKERDSLKDVLLHVIEVDRRQSYFDFNCSSLFAYMTEVMGYSNGPAQRRIDAARLSREVPQLVETIESGALNLDQVRLMQQSIRQVAKENHKTVTTEQKIQVFNEIAGKSLDESEVIVASSFDVKIRKSVKIQRQADESVTMEINFSKEKWAKLEEMRTLLSHSLPSGSWDDAFEYVADKVIRQKSKLVERRKYNRKASEVLNGSETGSFKGKKSSSIKSRTSVLDKIECSTSESSEKLKVIAPRISGHVSTRTAIPAEIERQVYKRDQFCQHKNPKTGKKCATKWKLQTDHIIPVWAGGDNSPGNLQLLCAGHNQAKYHKEAGIRRV